MLHGIFSAKRLMTVNTLALKMKMKMKICTGPFEPLCTPCTPCTLSPLAPLHPLNLLNLLSIMWMKSIMKWHWLNWHGEEIMKFSARMYQNKSEEKVTLICYTEEECFLWTKDQECNNFLIWKIWRILMDDEKM